MSGTQHSLQASVTHQEPRACRRHCFLSKCISQCSARVRCHGNRSLPFPSPSSSLSHGPWSRRSGPSGTCNTTHRGCPFASSPSSSVCAQPQAERGAKLGFTRTCPALPKEPGFLPAGVLACVRVSCVPVPGCEVPIVLYSIFLQPLEAGKRKMLV